MDSRSGRFRVYRVVEAVAHLNCFDVAADRLYSVHDRGYEPSLQSTVDDLTTGALVDATIAGDPDDETAAWRFEQIEPRPERAVTIDFLTDVTLPAVARDLWAPGSETPRGVGLGLDPEASADGATVDADAGGTADPELGRAVTPAGPPPPPDEWPPVDAAVGADADVAADTEIDTTTESGVDAATTVLGECWLQPRATLPNEAFGPNVATGLLPLERWFAALPLARAPAVECLVFDPDPPLADRYATPYGVVLFFPAHGRALADRYREHYDCPRGSRSVPTFDPYAP